MDATAIDDQNHFLPPAQLVSVPTYNALSPEARLALAVLEDAVMTLRAAAGVQTLRAQRRATQELMWIVSDDLSHPFTFLNICDYLGIDAVWLRTGIRRLRLDDGSLRRIRRLRPNARRERRLAIFERREHIG